MTETGSYAGLQETVAAVAYKPGWRFWLTTGLTMSAGAARVAGAPEEAPSTAGAPAILLPPVWLHIQIQTLDSTDTGEPRRYFITEHLFAVPDPVYIGYPMAWDRWLLERVFDVEHHEAMEFFTVAGKRPFYPAHGPGAPLYEVIRHDRL